jgi:hypothetical protein
VLVRQTGEPGEGRVQMKISRVDERKREHGRIREMEWWNGGVMRVLEDSLLS